MSPAVDDADPLARQQLHLAAAYVDFVRERLPHLMDRDRFELRHNIRLADAALLVVQEPVPTARLTDAVETARAVAVTAAASRAEVHRITAILAAHVSELLVVDLDDGTRQSLERTVLDISAERVEFERACYQPMGFDPHPESVTPLAEQLSAWRGVAVSDCPLRGASRGTPGRATGRATTAQRPRKAIEEPRCTAPVALPSQSAHEWAMS